MEVQQTVKYGKFLADPTQIKNSIENLLNDYTMKRLNLPLFILSVFFAAVIDTSCKSKEKETTDTSTMNSTADTSAAVTPPAPVEVASDDVLKQGVIDATKDYPTVKAEVVDSVINLSGEIKRADWQKLNPTLNSLHPKRVNSAALTIK